MLQKRIERDAKHSEAPHRRWMLDQAHSHSLPIVGHMGQTY